MRKKDLEGIVEKLPDEFKLDVLIDQLIFMEQVEIGFNQIDDGKGISLEEVKEKVSKWRK